MKKTKIISKKDNTPIPAKEYAQVLMEIKKQIEQSKVEGITAINLALNRRNWLLGQIIVEKQNEHKWGSNFLDNLAKDLQHIYPDSAGFSAANVYRMKAFYEAYREIRAAARELETLPIFAIPWFHNVILLQKLKDLPERLWYAQKSIEHGWSRSMLETWIKSDLYHREGKAVTNFKRTLPAPLSDMAQQSFKDPYVFDFLTLQEEHLEYDLEKGLIENVQKLLLEMGKGFALIARQYHLMVDDEDYYIDLLFYHVKLKCYVVVELKARAFDPRDVGQLNFYLSAVDDLVRDPEDKPTIGLLLCKTKKNFTAEYALRGVIKPIGVAEYETEIMKKLPKSLKSSLPTIEEIEAEFDKQKILAKKKPIKTATKDTTKK
jgi:predicted nuclease of restriction endonuclease-like (RecB) superfamily